jgi:hypothetical protein
VDEREAEIEAVGDGCSAGQSLVKERERQEEEGREIRGIRREWR